MSYEDGPMTAETHRENAMGCSRSQGTPEAAGTHHKLDRDLGRGT